MASNYQYIERPDKISNCCRLFDKKYKVYENEKTKKPTHESSVKLFKQNNNNKPSLSQRLSSVNLVIEDDPGFSNTICKVCESKIKKLEDAKEIKVQWSGVKRKIENTECEEENEDAPSVKNPTEDGKVSLNFFGL